MRTKKVVKKFICPEHLRCAHQGCTKVGAWWFNPDNGQPHVKLCDKHYIEAVDAWRSADSEADYDRFHLVGQGG